MFSALTAATLAAHAGPGFGFGWIFFIIIPLFFFGLFILFASLGRRRWMRAGGYGGYGPGHGGWGAPARRAESTLAERFAQGDIDEKEYRARLEVLRANDGKVDPS